MKELGIPPSQNCRRIKGARERSILLNDTVS
jgi:hypothetical protein